MLLIQTNYGKQMNKVPKKGEYVRFKNYENRIKPPFMIYADFESILVPKDNGKQNSAKAKEAKVLCEQISKLCCL